MNPSSATVSPLRQRMLDDMRMRNLAPKTQSAYIRAVRSLAGFLRRPPDTASAEGLRQFQLHLVDGGTSAVSSPEACPTPTLTGWQGHALAFAGKVSDNPKQKQTPANQRSLTFYPLQGFQ